MALTWPRRLWLSVLLQATWLTYAPARRVLPSPDMGLLSLAWPF